MCNIKKLVVLFAVFIFVSSCDNQKEIGKVLFPSVGVTEEKNELTKLSELFKGCELVRLETNDSCLVGRNGKVIKKDSIYYVQSFNDVLMFDNKGRYKRKISHMGQANSEYVKLYDFNVVETNGEQEVWVSTHGGIKIYDAINCSFKREIPIEGHVNQFYYVNDNAIIIVTPDEITFKVCDSKGNVRKTYFEKDLANCGRKIVQFTKLQDCVMYQLDDTNEAVVYDISSDAFSTEVIIPRQKRLLQIEDNQEYYERYGYIEQSQKIEEAFIRISSFRCYNNNIMMVTKYPTGESKLTLGNVSSCTTYKFDPAPSPLINDIFKSDDLRFLSTLIGCESDSGFLFLIPDELINENIDEENNPLLLDFPSIN